MDKPCFIVILTDDQGYGDLSCMGNTDFKTPNIDRLAESGVRFTDWYANGATCSPTRASILTGRYPRNAGVPRNINIHMVRNGTWQTKGLSNTVPTVATAMKDLGYGTAMFGKWHLGDVEGFRPVDHDFDETFVFRRGCIDYYSHLFFYEMPKGVNPMHDLWENGKEVYRNGEYMTEMITDRTVGFIRESCEKQRPFFIYVSYNAPHYPMHAPQKYLDRFSHLPWDRQIMAAMLSAVDDGVGEITDELERQGIADNTCIFLQSDNGPTRESRGWMDGREDFYYGGTTGRLKGQKGSLFEGGVRVPAMISWPAKVPAGRVSDLPGMSMDVFPTMVRAAGGELNRYDLDGVDVLPALSGASPPAERCLFWERNDQLAVRRGKWKLVLNGILVDEPDPDPVYLSDLSADMSESTNVAEEHPGVTEELTNLVRAWRDEAVRRFEASEFSNKDLVGKGKE
jgi:arylsulfatase A-like enzyme